MEEKLRKRKKFAKGKGWKGGNEVGGEEKGTAVPSNFERLRLLREFNRKLRVSKREMAIDRRVDWETDTQKNMYIDKLTMVDTYKERHWEIKI